MNGDDTQIFTKGAPKDTANSSMIAGVSVRAWLALILIVTVCLATVAKFVIAVIKQDASLLEITEPLYTMGGMALAYYFGASNKQPKQTT